MAVGNTDFAIRKALPSEVHLLGFTPDSVGIAIRRGVTDFQIGGQAFLAASAEIRVKATSTIGVVGFADIGRVDPQDFFDGGDWHAGAGLGLRYHTGFGPIRLDVAAPVGGNTGDGVQFYIGIGQAF